MAAQDMNIVGYILFGVNVWSQKIISLCRFFTVDRQVIQGEVVKQFLLLISFLL
jgi:hypothetical protein